MKIKSINYVWPAWPSQGIAGPVCGGVGVGQEKQLLFEKFVLEKRSIYEENWKMCNSG